MNLTFIGKGSAFLPTLKTTGAYFIKDRQLFIIDCGEDTFSELWKRNILAECENITVIITHLHADHVGSLGSLISYCKYILHRQVHVVHPISTIVDYLDLIGIKRDYYEYYHELPPQFDSVTAQAVEVNHVDNMKCFGYILGFGGENIYYSGDANHIPEEVLASFSKGNIDFICQDTMIVEKESEFQSHCTLRQLESLIAPQYRERVYCMHLDIMDESLIIAKGFKVVPVE